MDFKHYKLYWYRLLHSVSPLFDLYGIFGDYRPGINTYSDFCFGTINEVGKKMYHGHCTLVSYKCLLGYLNRFSRCNFPFLTSIFIFSINCYSQYSYSPSPLILGLVNLLFRHFNIETEKKRYIQR